MAAPLLPAENRTSGNAFTDMGLLWKRQVTRYYAKPIRIVGMLVRPLIWLLPTVTAAVLG